MRIIGIDPGSHRIGYAVLEKSYTQRSQLPTIIKYGTIEVPPGTKDPENLIIIYQSIQFIIKETKPEQAFIEDLFLIKNQKTAKRVFEAIGVILLALGESQIPYTQLTAKQIKKGISASGNATKKEIRKSIQKILGFELEGQDDSWDAIACAFIGFGIAQSNFPFIKF